MLFFQPRIPRHGAAEKTAWPLAGVPGLAVHSPTVAAHAGALPDDLQIRYWETAAPEVGGQYGTHQNKLLPSVIGLAPGPLIGQHHPRAKAPA